MLEELWLVGDNVGVEGAAAFRTALERNNSLRVLVLAGNNIRTKVLVTWLQLERNTTLTLLLLCGNNIMEDGSAALRTALETNFTLERLGVDGVDDDGDGSPNCGLACASGDMFAASASVKLSIDTRRNGL